MARSAVWIGGLVLTWLLLMLFSGARTYTMGPTGALGGTVIIGPMLLLSFYSLRALMRGSRHEALEVGEQTGLWLAGIGAAPLIVISPMVAMMVLGFARFMSGWSTPAGGSMLNVVFVVIGLHLLVWAGMGLLSAWASNQDD